MIRKIVLLVFIAVNQMCSGQQKYLQETDATPIVKGPEQKEILYSFFTAGHLYGKPGTDNDGLYPPFKLKLDLINSRKDIKFGVFLGDVIRRGKKEEWERVDKDIEKIIPEIYIAFGNHDYNSRKTSPERFLETYSSFEVNNDLHIILDPNLGKWNIKGDQLDFLRNTLRKKSSQVNNIFVYFHHLLWWSADNKYSPFRPNSLARRAESINFWTEVVPLFTELENDVYLYAGDIGANVRSKNCFYDTFDNIHLIGTGVGNGKGDNFLITQIYSDKEVEIKLVSLMSEDISSLGNFLDYCTYKN